MFSKRTHISSAESSEELFERVRTGDHAAFDTLYARHASTLTAYANVVLREHEAVRDALQFAWTTALSNAAGFQGGNFDAWIFTILRNECLRMKRRLKRFPMADENAIELMVDTSAQSSSLDPHDRNVVRKALESLSEDDSMIISLRYDEDLSYADIALALGISVDATKVRLFRARKRIAEILKPLFEERHDNP